MTFIDNQNALYEIFEDKKLAYDLNQYLTNKSVTVIPINPHGLQENMITPGQNVSFHIEYD